MAILGEGGVFRIQKPDGTWLGIFEMTKWSLDASAATIDPTTVEKWFAEPERARVSGSGSLDFWVNRAHALDVAGSTYLLDLMLNVTGGATAAAEFWIRQGGSMECDPEGVTLLPGDIYYETTIVLVGTGVNTRRHDLIPGTCEFLTHGPIILKQYA